MKAKATVFELEVPAGSSLQQSTFFVLVGLWEVCEMWCCSMSMENEAPS